jgi:hypothetical protein
VNCGNGLTRDNFPHEQFESMKRDEVFNYNVHVPIPGAVRSKMWAYGRSIAGIAGSNLAWDMDICLV